MAETLPFSSDRPPSHPGFEEALGLLRSILHQTQALTAVLAGGRMPPPSAPAEPAELLRGWKQIFEAIGLKDYDNQAKRRWVLAMNACRNGPIQRDTPRGLPWADKSTLVAWRRRICGLDEEAGEEVRQREMDVQGTLQARHPYGREGEVVPEIAGSIQKAPRRVG